MEMDFVWVGLLDRWGLFRFDILRGLLSGDWGPHIAGTGPAICGAPDGRGFAMLNCGGRVSEK